tara:strand:- start:722 stop:871 length:150 start_codon:yes stop_codon:yes gene_type:complete
LARINKLFPVVYFSNDASALQRNEENSIIDMINSINPALSGVFCLWDGG